MWTWTCPRCGVIQRCDEVRTVEIVEPGKGVRVEYHGKIRPSYNPLLSDEHISYSCLVCGHVWTDPPEDPTPGGASITFIHPVLEDEGFDGLTEWGRERDAC